jgi:hypothetical protein
LAKRKTKQSPKDVWAINGYAGLSWVEPTPEPEPEVSPLAGILSGFDAGMPSAALEGLDFGLGLSRDQEQEQEQEEEVEQSGAVALLRARIAAVHDHYPGCRVEIDRAYGDGNDTFAVWIPANVPPRTKAPLTDFDHSIGVTKKVYVSTPKAPTPKVKATPPMRFVPPYTYPEEGDYADLSAIGGYDAPITRLYKKKLSPQQKLAEARSRAEKADASYCRAQRRKAAAEKKLAKVSRQVASETSRRAAKKKTNAVKRIVREAKKAGIPQNKIDCIQKCWRY